MNEYLAKIAPIMQVYKAEAAALGFTISSAIGVYLGWEPEITALVATVIGYALAYLRVK